MEENLRQPMNPALLLDGRLLFIVALAGAVSMLTTLNVAARPAAVRTGQVNLAFSVSQIFFMLTRFANLFYLPILATYVDEAVRTGRVDVLYGQIRWVVVGASGGALMSWVLLPTFIAVYERGIQAVERLGSVPRVLLRVPTPAGLRACLSCLRPPSRLGVEALLPRGIPWDFLLWNVAATAVWTVGALCALYVSAVVPRFEATAVLLSGLVNAFAAIAFTIFVDPRAAVITDQAVRQKRKARDVARLAAFSGIPPGPGPALVPPALELLHRVAREEEDQGARRVLSMSYFLGAGNFLGSLLGLAVLPLGVAAIHRATGWVGAGGGELVGSIWVVVALNAVVTLLASTTVMSRVSAAVTRHAATALAVYNLFFLITRLAQQVYAPVLGSVRDHVVAGRAEPQTLLPMFRWIVLGATLGVALGWLLMPTFIEVYNRAVRTLNRRQGSMAILFVTTLTPRRWGSIFRSLRPPSLFGVTLADLASLPKPFLVGNVVVLAVHTIGVMAAIYAGALLSANLARTATLLSSVVNGVATILLSIVVDPTAARITDQAIHGRRPLRHVYAMAVFLIAGMFLGTLFSQALFVPAANLIAWGATLLDRRLAAL